MALKTYTPEQIIYQKGTKVNEIAILIKGQVKMLIGSVHIVMDAGSVIGLDVNPRGDHQFSFKSSTDVAIYTYEYTSMEGLIDMLQENVKLAPTITMHLVSHCCSLYSLTEEVHQKAENMYEQVMSDFKKYPDLCAKTGTKVENFDYITLLENPNTPFEVAHWSVDYFKALRENEKKMVPVYSLGADVCSGFLVHCFDFLSNLTKDIETVLSAMDEYNRHTVQFRRVTDALHKEERAIETGVKEMDIPSLEGFLPYILEYTEADSELSSEITQTLDSYYAMSDRSDTNDTLRSLRRKITNSFFILYKQALLKSFTESEVPAIIDMFLMFGILDERFVDSEDMEKLYGFYCTYNPGPDCHIIAAKDWLKKVYCQETEPSLNEFQQDYGAYLREAKQNGDLKAEDVERMKDDPGAKLDFELKNFFQMGCRMTFGRVSLYTPLFDSQVAMLPLERSYVSEERLQEELERMYKFDATIFYREKLFTLPSNTSVQLYVHEKQPPYMILMPNTGSKMILWQNIEGRIRNSSARMMVPMFFEENFSDSVTGLCADYRWEVCKTDQGVRWTDITDPSLTAEYHDYLQFYKKNSALSTDIKEKVKAQLKKYSNNYKKVFVSDYLAYIKYEGEGNMRMNKYAREIMFKYCFFNRELCEKHGASPSYSPLIERKKNKIEQKVRPVLNIIQKLEHAELDVPEELLNEVEFYKL